MTSQKGGMGIKFPERNVTTDKWRFCEKVDRETTFYLSWKVVVHFEKYLSKRTSDLSQFSKTTVVLLATFSWLVANTAKYVDDLAFGQDGGLSITIALQHTGWLLQNKFPITKIRGLRGPFIFAMRTIVPGKMVFISKQTRACHRHHIEKLSLMCDQPKNHATIHWIYRVWI